MRRRVAAVPIAVFLAVGLQAVGIHDYTHLPRLGNVWPERYSKRLPFPSMQLCAASALTMNIIATSRARHVERVIVAEGI